LDTAEFCYHAIVTIDDDYTARNSIVYRLDEAEGLQAKEKREEGGREGGEGGREGGGGGGGAGGKRAVVGRR